MMLFASIVALNTLVCRVFRLLRLGLQPNYSNRSVCMSTDMCFRSLHVTRSGDVDVTDGGGKPPNEVDHRTQGIEE